MNKTILLFCVSVIALAACSSAMTDDNNGNGGGELLPAPDTMVPAPKAGTVYGTWIMVWNSSTEDWWKKEDIYGLQTVWPDGSWGAMDWNSEDYRMNTYDHLEKAGINFIVTDNTNFTLAKTDSLAKDLKKKPRNLKFCVALGHKQLQAETARTWLPEISSDPNYFKIKGQPVLVCYVAKQQWNDIYQHAIGDPLLKKFYRVWASGEDTSPDKWGWQVEPEDGLAESRFATYPTPSVKPQHRIDETDVCWSRSIAMIDYTFWQTRVFAPQYVIAGSYDDPAERNGWLPLKTENARPEKVKFTPVTGIQMFDPWTGKIAEPYLFYNRMKSWIKGEELYHVPDGILSDGIYRIRHNSGKYIQSNPDYDNPSVLYGDMSKHTYDEFLLYHLGENRYRIVNVYTGKPLRPEAGKILSADWTSDPSGEFRITAGKGSSEWILEPVGTFFRNEKSLECSLSLSDGSLMGLDRFEAIQ